MALLVQTHIAFSILWYFQKFDQLAWICLCCSSFIYYIPTVVSPPFLLQSPSHLPSTPGPPSFHPSEKGCLSGTPTKQDLMCYYIYIMCYYKTRHTITSRLVEATQQEENGTNKTCHQYSSNYFKKQKKKEHYQIHFMVTVTLISKIHNDSIKKGNYRSIFLTNIDAKIFIEILTNQI